MTDPLKKLGKTAKKSAKQMAQQMAKQVKQESEQFLKSGKTQAMGEKSSDQPSIYEGLVGNGVLSEEEEKKIKRREIARKEIVEQEISQYRVQRGKREEEWGQEQEEKMVATKHVQEEKGFVALPSSPKKGPAGPRGKKKTKGTREMIKSKR